MVTRDEPRCVSAQSFFFTEKHRIHFLKLLEEISSTYAIEVHAYCLYPVLGDEDERDEVYEYLQSQSLSAEIVGAKNIIIPPDIKTIVKAVAEYYGEDVDNIYQCTRRVKNEPRRVAILLSRELGGYSLKLSQKKWEM